MTTLAVVMATFRGAFLPRQLESIARRARAPDVLVVSIIEAAIALSLGPPRTAA
jgi:hypothetical protein